jgi:chromosomal replication initiator protein
MMCLTYPLAFPHFIMDVDTLWTNILGEIEVEVNPGTYSAYFKSTHCTFSSRDNRATIVCANGYTAGLLQTRYSQLIKHHLEKRLSVPVTVEFKAEAKPLSDAESGPLFTTLPSRDKDAVVRQYGLNPLYTFDNFAVSETNQMAYAASQAVSAKPGISYNPLFLWGQTGVGKTHLMQAIGREIVLSRKDTKLVYCTAEEFTNDIVDAIRGHTTQSFKRKYRSVSLLMIDDIQFIAGRESVQMEFFHTFNSIIQAGGQIILTSDKQPSDIGKLEARLRSRFEGGLIIDIAPPNFELRTAIIQIKARERGISLSSNATQQLAATIEDARKLEGALLRFMSEQQHEFDTDKIIAKITNSVPQGPKKGMSPHKIIDVVSGYFDVKLSQLAGKSRKRQVAEPRQILMFILRTELGIPLTEIGALLGGRDHTTILHGYEKILHLLPKNERFRNHLTEIRKLLSH